MPDSLLHMPRAVIDAIGAAIPPAERDALAAAVDRVVHQLSEVVDGRASPPSPIVQENAACIRSALIQAYETRSALTIDYLSPAQGQITHRTIEPITPITCFGEAEYIEAWCHLADATRTFRVDRILRVLESL
jgi:proteasome accessory factor C